MVDTFPAVETHDLRKRFGDLAAVDGVSLRVKRGEIFGLLGPNGAGKTTLISILATMLRPTSGRARVWAHDVVKEPETVRRLIGMVFQDPALDDQLTGEENMRFHARLYKMARGEIDERIKRMLDLVDLYDRRGDLVRTYSGGMRRRLEIARGLLHRPKVLFLDEPTLGLDPQTRRHIWDHIRGLKRSEGITILITTHYMDEADELCDRVAIIDHGRIVQMDTPADLKDALGGDIITVSLRGHAPDDLERFTGEVSRMEEVSAIKHMGEGVRITARRGEEVIPRVIEAAGRSNLRAASVMLHEPTLEDVFLKHTGRRIRDEHESSRAYMLNAIRRRRRMGH